MGRIGRLSVKFAIALVLLPGCGSDDESSTTDADTAAQQPAAAAPAPLPAFPTATCRVHTEEPGALVFIDGSPVLGPDGDTIVTPCRVTAAPGSHVVTVARQGRGDRSRQIVFGVDEADLFFEEVTSNVETAGSVLSAPLLNVPVGEPVALESLNSTGRELDPYVTSDGLSIWFAADRAEGRGIYIATRQSPLEQFGPPRLLDMTRGADLPASPSLTGDQRSVVYVVPDKARIWALTRPSPLGDFNDRIPLFFRSESAGARWPSAQILADGQRVYFARETAEETETRVVIRESPDDDFRRELVVRFPGLHPCLSSDGLRQYAFDGTKVIRARRSTVREPFSAPETLAELALTDYSPSSLYRQYFVSEDEQWMFYSDDPDEAGDLYVVRLFNGPGWGVALVGEPIEQMTLAQFQALSRPAETVATVPKSEPEPEPEEPVDPRTLPLPYTQFQTQLVELLQQRNYEAAAEFVDSAGEIPDLPPDSELVAWDVRDVGRLRGFWTDVTDAVGKLNPGDEFRLGPVRVEFVRFEEGRLVAKALTRELQRDLTELDPLDLLALVDREMAESDVDYQVRAATFVLYETDVPASTRNRRIAAGGPQAVEIVEQFAGRLIQQAEAELARDNAGVAVSFVDRAETDFPDTAAAQRAAELRGQLYAAAWRTVGGREWRTGTDGEFTAGPERVEDALLISKREYERFQLSMEYRTNTRTGQGGVFFRYAGSGRLTGRCFKIQLSNDRGVVTDEYCTGSLFGLEAPRANAAGDMGDWNTFRLRVDGEDFTVTINDRVVLDSDAIDDQIPDSGFVALDGITGGISYRKVLLTELPP